MTQPSQQLNASSRIMYQEAIKRGISCTLFGDRECILMELGDMKWYVRGSRTSFQSSVGKSIADNKILTKKVLDYYKLPISRFISVSNEEDLIKIRGLNFPLVMKPVDARHGLGVRLGIMTQEEAFSAYHTSKDKYKKVLFEETLEGSEYRIVCVDFKFIAASFRKEAHIIGDGMLSIRELIDQKNQHPWRGQGHSSNLTLIEVDEIVESLLKAQGHTVSSVPSMSEEIILRKTANLSTGGEAWDVTDQVCQENRQLFEQIARACDLNVIGIDIMCSTLKASIATQHKAGVIEVNASPGLRMHHFPIKGLSRNIAHEILELALRKAGE